MSGKLAYVTGGMGGIGTAICQRLAKDGFRVVAGCGPSRNYQQWLDEQAAQGYTFYASVGNVSDWESTVKAFERVTADLGQVDVLVNNAGITRDGLFRKMSVDDWRAVIDTNLNSLFNVTKQVLDGMVERQWGRIVNISSVNGQKGQFGQTNYSTPRRVSMVSPWPWPRRSPARALPSTPFRRATSGPTWCGPSVPTCWRKSSRRFRCAGWVRPRKSRP